MQVRSTGCFSLAGAALLALAACSGDRPSAAVQGPAVHTVRRGDLRITVDEPAELQAAVKTTIKSKVKGWAALIFLIPEGTAVEEGELLAELDVSKHQEYRAKQAISVGRARAALEQGRKNLAIVETRLLAAKYAAVSAFRMAEMELEKFLGRVAEVPADGVPARGGTNLEMVERLEAMLAKEFLDDPGSEVKYAGLADGVRDLLGEENLHRAMGQTANLVLSQIDRISLARADLKLKGETLEHSRGLAQLDFITKNELEKDKLAHESQLSRVTLSWNNIDLLINYTLQQDQIRRRQAVINTDLDLENTLARNEATRVREQAEVMSQELEYNLARERLENVETQIVDALIYAPHPGVVIYGKQGREWWKPAVEEGNMIRERQNLVVLPDVTRMVAEFTIHESHIEQVSLDQQVTVQVDAFQERMFTGRVTQIDGVASSARSHMSSSALKTYKTTVTLDGVNFDGALRPGMNAAVQILVSTAKDVISVPIEAIRRDRQAHYVWKQTAGAPIAQPVRLGVNNLTHVAIEEGLAEGEKVYLDIPAGIDPPRLDQPDPSAESRWEKNGE